MNTSRQKYLNYSISFLVIFGLLMLLSFVLLKGQEPAGQKVKTKFKQGKVLASKSWYLESPFILDEIIADNLQRDIFKAFSTKVSGPGENNFRFLVAKGTEISIEAQVRNLAKTPRIWLYNSESKLVQKPKLIRLPGKLIYKFKIQEQDLYKIKSYFDYGNLLSLKLIAKVEEKEDPNLLRKAYLKRATKILEINISKQQEKALKDLTRKQFEIFKHYKTNPLPKDVASRPLKKTGGRVLIKVRAPGDTWSVASMGIAGRTFEHQDLAKLFGSVDIKVLSGQLPLNMKRFKLYTLQAKSFTRDFLFEQNLKDLGLLVPRQDLVKVIVNGELYGYMELLETPSSHFFEYAQKIEGIIYGYNAGSIHDHLRDSTFVEEHGGKTKAKKGARHMASFDFSDYICKPSMDLFSSFVYAYGAIHGFGHADLSFHDNSRLACLSPIPRDVSTGLFSPYFKGDQGNQNPSFALGLAFFDLLAPQWRPDVVGRAESFMLHKASSSEPDLAYHHFAQMPATLRYYFKQQNIDDLIEYSKYWASDSSRTNLKRRVENFSYALGEIARDLSPAQKEMPRVVAYHLRNAIQLADKHPKDLIKSKALVADSHLRKIIEGVSSKQIKVSNWDLRALATRNQIVESLGLPAGGLDLAKSSSVINFLYRQESEDELRVVFVERGAKLLQGKFRLQERDGGIIEPSAIRDFGSQAYSIDKKSIALAQIKPNEKLRAYYFKIPKTDSYRYFGYKLSGDKQVWASREFVAAPKVLAQDSAYSKENLAQFFNINGKQLSFKAKAPVVYNSLEIPPGYKLIVNQDRSIKFATNGCMMVYGSMNISPQANLELSPAASGWSGIHFLSNSDLNLRNIKISNIGDSSYGVKCGGRDFSGGVSFFDTKVNLNNVQVLNSNVEDAMHFLRTELVMTDSLVSGAQSDAIDADFSNLQINKSKLEGSKGDGLDVSGSLGLLKGLESINQVDKGLSVGENSNVFVFDSIFSSKEYCIAIKDSSRLYLDSASQLLACKTPVGEYIKKPYFTSPKLVRI